MAAKRSKVAAAAAAPYVRRVISDQELRDNVRVALDSAREAFARLQNGKAPANVVLDDKKFKKNVSQAASALKDATDALRQAPKRSTPKRRGGLGRKLLLLVLGAAIALAVSEDLRNKVLDALFGKEEEFDYSSPAPEAAEPDAAPAPEPSASTA
jgi:hypothetical protein